MRGRGYRSMFLWRRPWVAVLAVVAGLLLGVLAGALTGTPGVTRTVVRSVPAPADPARAPLADTGARRPAPDLLAPEVRARTGDYVADGGATIRVLSVRPVRELPRRSRDDGPLRPRRGERLWAAVIEWRNGRPEPEDGFCSTLTVGTRLVDAEDVFFRADDDAVTDLAANDGSCEETNPGGGGRITMPYLLPADRPPVGLAFWDIDPFDDDGRSWAFVRTDGAGA